MSTQTSQGTALITGASSGIGAIYADRLARRGYDLILVARNQSRLEALAARLRDETGCSVEIVTADLNDDADLRRVETILRTNSTISMLVNNAGIGGAAPLLASDVEAMDRMIRLNVLALTRLTYAAAPAFVDTAAARSSTSHPLLLSRRKPLMASTADPRPSSWPSASPSSTNWQRRACGSKRSCPEPPRQSSGTSPGCR